MKAASEAGAIGQIAQWSTVQADLAENPPGSGGESATGKPETWSRMRQKVAQKAPPASPRPKRGGRWQGQRSDLTSAADMPKSFRKLLDELRLDRFTAQLAQRVGKLPEPRALQGAKRRSS
jgi:hypothetical protein